MQARKILIFLILLFLIVIISISAIVSSILMDNNNSIADNNMKSKVILQMKNKSGDSRFLSEIGEIYSLDQFVLNVRSKEGKCTLKLSMNFEIENEALAAELEEKKPIIRDTIITILSSKDIEIISKNKGNEKLKNEIMRKVNLHLKNGKIKNVYFTDFIVK
ncbi:MAG: flagellar basal body-associated FliL family protein [Sulfuricurvum sp.]|nr:flagellar basal body-associated FliL family protein [Sulfuricurvum sp.]